MCLTVLIPVYFCVYCVNELLSLKCIRQKLINEYRCMRTTHQPP